MTRQRQITIFAAVSALGALTWAAARAQDAPRIATGFVAHTLCSAAFVSGVDPDAAYAETLEAMPGVGLIGWALRYNVDRDRREVTSTLLGGSRSRAVERAGLGCRLVDEGESAAATPLPTVAPQRPLLPEIAGPAMVEAATPELRQALDRAFAEPEQPPLRHTKAIVVLKDGRVIAERYAPGYGIDTPVLGWSATKSVMSALSGILVRQGKLALDQPAAVAAWRSPGDPRHAITLDHLLRHTSGLAMGSSLQASLASTIAPVNQMKFAERDMAGFAERAALETAPGSAWNYHDGNTVILSRLIRDAVGGTAADVLRFARRELFDPLGMRNVTLEFDATGTPEGSSQMLAPARAWARFGQLYLDDGMVGGKRILPERWVAVSATPTPEAWVGIGAGFWTNRGDSFGAKFRTGHGWPADSFYASGTFGQYVIVLPSQRLVIARFGIARDRGDIEGVSRLVADVISATRSERDAP
ncbi:serine hydrolase domain-containing protein [Rhodopseudomonas sp. RCAM05734]|uniref:serine hydrolase domain-containing protein n=1 Tax=Rhodopseudomonas sp. RCAM05734 TaxID=3457549 RepID=UPI00404478A7